MKQVCISIYILYFVLYLNKIIKAQNIKTDCTNTNSLNTYLPHQIKRIKMDSNISNNTNKESIKKELLEFGFKEELIDIAIEITDNVEEGANWYALFINTLNILSI